MKKLLYTFFAVSLIFSACKKEDEVITQTLVNGCTNENANNFNTNANNDDGSCIYSGCMDSTATNYNLLATIEDSSCTYPIVYGCMDSTATNYNPTATEDDGSCITIVGTWSPTSAEVNYSVTMGGMTLMDTSYTTTPSDPEWEFEDITFDADGNVTIGGETETYTYSGTELIITESDGESETMTCTVTSTDMVVIINDTEEEDGMTITSNIIINHTRQ